MVPVRIHAAVACAIALIALGVGQIMPGLGILFVALTSTLWTACSVRRQRRGCQGD